ncbi:MAG: hypothetical protein ACJAX5_002973, partial [Patiriisocius sp.]
LGTVGANASIDLNNQKCPCMEINANHIAAVLS